jgi:hypothetical protein
LVQLSPLVEAYGSQKPPDIIERFELWPEADLFRTAFPMIFRAKFINGGIESQRNQAPE